MRSHLLFGRIFYIISILLKTGFIWIKKKHKLLALPMDGGISLIHKINPTMKKLINENSEVSVLTNDYL